MAQSQSDYIPQKRWWLKPLVAVVLLGVVGWGGYLAYLRWEPDRLARQAREYLEKGDSGSALLSLRRAFQLNPNNEAASRVMAEITSELNSPSALEWHRRLVELKPESAQDAYAWAGTAVRQGQVAVAEQALAAVPERERNTARYHALQGTLALHRGDAAGAERSFSEAVRLEPAKELHRYNLATLQLQSADPARRGLARKTLEELAQGGAMQIVAQRALVTFLMGEEELPAALEYSGKLQANEEVRFPDRLVHLQLLARVRPEVVSDQLPAVQKSAETSPDAIGQMMHWMRTNARDQQAMEWMETLDPKLQASGPVAAARAEILLARKDWDALRDFCAAGDWGEMEYLRLAFLARAARERNDSGARAHWTAASAAAGRDRHRASRLAWIAQQWGWTDEFREALWAGTSSPAPGWALQMLHESYFAEGATEGLARVATKMLETEPENAAAKNNLAMFSLLRGERLDAALEDATTLYKSAPENAGFASTYAFALHVHGRTGEAIAVLQKLDPAAQMHPSVAAYYGLFLSANGDREKARPYLEAAQKASLLPEEKALLASVTGADASADSAK